MALLALLSVVFGLILTWKHGNIGEGLNFVLAGFVFAYLRGSDFLDFTRRR